MEIVLSAQLRELLLSFSLGLLCGLLYDLLRAFRLRHRTKGLLTHLLDGFFAVLCAVLFLFLTLRQGDGQLQLYAVAACGGGCVFWLLCPGPWCREIWDFWAAALEALGRALMLPARLFGRGTKWFFRFLKKLFSSLPECATIRKITRPFERKERLSVRTKEKKKPAHRANPLVLAVILLFIVVVGIQIVKVYMKVSAARGEEDTLTRQKQVLSDENEALKEDLEKADDEEFLKSLARQKGWYDDGTRLFIDPNQ